MLVSQCIQPSLCVLWCGQWTLCCATVSLLSHRLFRMSCAQGIRQLCVKPLCHLGGSCDSLSFSAWPTDATGIKVVPSRLHHLVYLLCCCQWSQHCAAHQGIPLLPNKPHQQVHPIFCCSAVVVSRVSRCFLLLSYRCNTPAGSFATSHNVDIAFLAFAWCKRTHAFAERISSDSASRLCTKNSTFAHLELHDITLQLTTDLIALGTGLQLTQIALLPILLALLLCKAVQ
jgi:hypothetical protein